MEELCLSKVQPGRVVIDPDMDFYAMILIMQIALTYRRLEYLSLQHFGATTVFLKTT